MRPMGNFSAPARRAALAGGAVLLAALGGARPGWAQATPSADTLAAHLRRVEQRLDTLDRQVTERVQDVRQLTRRSLENAQNGRFVVRGLVRDTYLTVGGFIEADAMYSFRPLGVETQLVPSSIPVPNGHTPSTSFSPNPSRLYFRSLTKPARGPVVKTWLEFDFFNEDGTTNPRLRHAWAEVGGLGVGQTWSLFMDADAFPNTLDVKAPNAMIKIRQVQIRYAGQLRPGLLAGASLEQPGSQLRFADSSGRYAPHALYPDLVGALRLGSTPHRYVRLAALLHPLTYRDQPADALTTRLAWGLNLSGNLELWKKEIITFQAAYGHGLSRYVNDLGGGAGADAWLPAAGALRPVPALAVYGFYDHAWARRWNSSVGWGYLRLQPVADQPLTAFRSSSYGIANLIFSPATYLRAGVEYQYADHRLLTGQQGRGSRLQLTVQSIF